jgi:hypothetical protein
MNHLEMLYLNCRAGEQMGRGGHGGRRAARVVIKRTSTRVNLRKPNAPGRFMDDSVLRQTFYRGAHFQNWPAIPVPSLSTPLDDIE